MKLPNVPVLLALDRLVTIPLRALVKVAVEGIQILPRRASESYSIYWPTPVIPVIEKLPLLAMVTHETPAQLG